VEDKHWAGEIGLAVGVGKQGQAWDTLVVPVDILDRLAGWQWEGRDCPGQESALLPSDQLGRAEPCCLSPSSLQTTAS